MKLFFTVFFSLLLVQVGISRQKIAMNEDGSFTIRFIPKEAYLDSILVDYTGIWSPGFEQNLFIPCGKWLPDSLGGIVFDSEKIGLSYGEEVWDYAFKTNPDTLAFLMSKPKNTAIEFFIEAKGWLIGPGMYNHFGVNRYTIKTTNFKKVRWLKYKECLD